MEKASDDEDHRKTSSDGGDEKEVKAVNVNHPTTTRSYECNFCKRGFSNAQALGGHMNLHRKDKAKIKEQQQQQQYSSSSSTSNQQFLLEGNLGNLSHNKELGNVPHQAVMEDETKMMRQQLPLFAESSPHHHLLQQQEDQTSGHEGRRPELDLELRLGPEPPQGSSSSPSPPTTGGNTNPTGEYSTLVNPFESSCQPYPLDRIHDLLIIRKDLNHLTMTSICIFYVLNM
ncbi:hypothetical protein PIB30_016068 [Stylosanthes scabra]|uniref:C2H2-type domain-containing protein n=1 Tax=Stylosanthes scabra TaxID=79078 RepID=A0ABU6Z3V2_9FABA|nr:hypothetical protein [Stylosanthes scabra]